MHRIFKNVRGLLAVLGVAALLLLSSIRLEAQTFRGGISGAVTDPSGGAVPNVVVVATADDTGLAHRTTSSGAGEYGFQDLPLGTYTISATGTGFQTLQVKMSR